MTDPKLVGRRDDLSWLHNQLGADVLSTSGAARTSFVQGLHGIGKTTLMHAFAKKLVAEAQKDVRYVDFQACEQSADAFKTVEHQALTDATRNTVIVFDEVEARLTCEDEQSVVSFLRKLAWRQQLSSTDLRDRVPIFVVARRDWRIVEPRIRPDSPRIATCRTRLIGELTYEDADLLIQVRLRNILKDNDDILDWAARIWSIAGGHPLFIVQATDAVDELTRLGSVTMRAVTERLAQRMEWYFRSVWDLLSAPEKACMVAQVAGSMGMAPRMRSQPFSAVATLEQLGLIRNGELAAPLFAWWIAANMPHLLASAPENDRWQIFFERIGQVADLCSKTVAASKGIMGFLKLLGIIV